MWGGGWGGAAGAGAGNRSVILGKRLISLLVN